MQHLISSLLFLAFGCLSGCATTDVEPAVIGCQTMECVAIGEPQEAGQHEGDLVVTPLAVLEDSRCPIEAECVWAGRLRLNAQLQLGHEIITVELDSGNPMKINGGTLRIAEIASESSVQLAPIQPSDYSFGFVFNPDAKQPTLAPVI